ncbi:MULTISPECIES: DNA polymerase IV [unclassified Nocardioides]|uniref:DNA polymerase IV n=1 Tax=unclassified Nocardioides TaxID=2615069 RepID=UPI0006F6943E|nr:MULTISPECIES: DNA polymerase IV [unclassified Nocardioides]KRA37381.1 DNA polymerase IV [Nocardioides sp. Root614]KRA91342.1 DNA polymerase IV [Nocardioides sp. Root682]
MTAPPVCPILHVDMDAFYAAVMIRDRPELHHVPVVVGGGHRGVVLSANYPARRFGIRSGMSGTEARRLCPQAVTMPPDFSVLTPVSRAIMETFRTVTPLVEVTSLDEAFLDVRGAVRLFGPPEDIAELIRARIHSEHQITCSVGIAATISVAKLASRQAKPDGVRVISPDRFVALVHPLDVGVLYGVGEATRQRLHRLGLETVGDVAAIPVDQLRRMLGGHLGHHLHTLVWGTDRTELVPGGAGVFGFGEGEPEGSMGAQHTLAIDIRDRRSLHRELLRLVSRVAARVRAAGKCGRTVAITVRFSDFTTVNRSRTLREPTDVTQEVYAVAVALLDVLLDGLAPRRPAVRLVGVRVEGLRTRQEGDSRQLVLGERDPGWTDADRAVDRAALRFGASAVRRASLL